MCGINGTLALDDAYRVDVALLARMRDTLAHRGPDGADAWVSGDRRVGLAFRRLAIIDLSDTAMQPMPNEDGSVRVVFNGEIYNHLELRAELLERGHVFSTDHSDTEAIVHGFEEWGIEVLHRLRGMFAIGIWDERERALWLARDRIGIKPLYWSLHHGHLNFASEIKALLLDPQQERAVDEEALYHYLSFLATPAPQTLFRGIRKLAGGTWLRIGSDGTLRERRYWDVWDGVEPLVDVPEDEIAARVLDELRTSVRLRKLADVPVGVFLSGGIDSSTNAALFSEGEGAPVRTFSIGYEHDDPTYRNEFAYARLMADFVGADHHERRLTIDDALGFLPEMVRLQDEPIADSTCVPHYFVSQLARDNGLVVAQVGEGADELFWGYRSWKVLLALQRANDLPVPRSLKHAGVAVAAAVGQGRRREVEYLRRAAEQIPVFWSGAESFTEAQKRALLAPRLRSELSSLSSWDAIAPIRRRFEDGAWERSHLNWMTYADLNLRLPELLLMRVDKMSMGVSIEGRVPFLDHRFVELALSIPERSKTNGGTLKHILKKAVRGVIPDELIDRPKQGFGVPLHEWFVEGLGETARRELDRFTRETGYLDRGEVMRYVDGGRRRETWYLLNLALWWKEYMA
jgi:asparagine synthase (glutamine-hydrolysing)